MKKRNPSPNYNKVAIVWGATGQIGSYLCEYLLSLGYGQVIGVNRRTSGDNTERLSEIHDHPNFVLAKADITDSYSINRLFSKYISDKDLNYEVYNLAAQSHVHVSFEQPATTLDVTGKGHLNILEEVLRFCNLGYKVKTYFQASSEMYGKNKDISGFQTTATHMEPCSPYGAAKLYAFTMNKIYRESYQMWNSSGIIFNTESSRRGEEFVTRKITKWMAQAAAHNFDVPKLQLGNIDAFRDWTHAKDIVVAIHLIMNAPRPKDYIVASGETHSVKDFLQESFLSVQDFSGNKCEKALTDLYECNSDLFRPNEVPFLKGKADAIREELGWKPNISFADLVYEMVSVDFNRVSLDSTTI